MRRQRRRLGVLIPPAVIVLPIDWTPAPSEELLEDEIANRAYAYWEARDFQGGSALEDWYRAVRELNEERSRPNG
jgi:hypothetical protein